MPLPRCCRLVLCCCKNSEKKTTRRTEKEVAEDRAECSEVEAVSGENYSNSNVLGTPKDRTSVELTTYESDASLFIGRMRTKDESEGADLSFFFREVPSCSPCDQETSLLGTSGVVDATLTSPACTSGYTSSNPSVWRKSPGSILPQENVSPQSLPAMDKNNKESPCPNSKETTDVQCRKHDHFHNSSACKRVPESLDASDEQDNHLSPPGRDIIVRGSVNDGEDAQRNADSESTRASDKYMLSVPDALVHKRVNPVSVTESMTDDVPDAPYLTLQNDGGELDDSTQPREIEQETESSERRDVKGHPPLKETNNGEDGHLETQKNFMPSRLLQNESNEQNGLEKPTTTSQAMLGETSADDSSFELVKSNPSMHVSESDHRRDQGNSHSLGEKMDGSNSSSHGEATQAPTCQYTGCTRHLPDEDGFYSSCFCEAHREKGTKVVCQSHERFTAGVIEVASQEPTNQGANVHQITMKKGSLEKNPADQCRESPTGNLTLSKDNSESESCSGGPIQAQKGTLSLTKGVSGNLTQLSPSDHNKSKPVEHSNSHDQPKVQVPKETCGVLPPDIPTAMQPIMRKDNSHPDARPLQGNQENKYSEVTTKQSDTKFNIKYKDDNQKEKEKPVASSESAIIPTSFGTKPTSSGMSVQKQSSHRNRKSGSRQSDAKSRQMRKPICFYHKEDPYYEFTNFYLVYVQIDGKYWSTTENYFQAQKYIGTPLYRAIQECSTARQAFTLSRSPQGSRWRRSDWEEVKQDVMYVALYAKFTQHQELKKLLLKTGDRPLIEHTERDSYWGDGGDGSGQNHLGKLLMRLRKELSLKEQ